MLLYLALAYGTDRNLHPAEHHMIVRMICRWVPGTPRELAETVLSAALVAMRQRPEQDVEALARELRPVLPLGLRRRVLAHLGRLARADGQVSVEEADVIARVRAVWEA